jgi:hypothetical protein
LFQQVKYYLVKENIIGNKLRKINMIEDISTTKDIVKEEQIKTCDICNNEITTIVYLNVSSSSSSSSSSRSNNNKTKKSEVLTNNNDDLSDKYYNICLNCVEKITELMKYNYGFNGRLIQFFESLK